MKHFSDVRTELKQEVEDTNNAVSGILQHNSQFFHVIQLNTRTGYNIFLI